MIRIAFLLIVAVLGVHSSAGAVQHELFTLILRDHVKDGRVDYAAIRQDERLNAYLLQFSSTIPDTIATRRDQLAFWINAYNAFTVKLIVDNYPLKSIGDLHFGGLHIATVLKKTAWDNRFITINERELTLNDIEHKIIRKQFADPRIHFALVCAAKSCPPLRSEAYEGLSLNDQLDSQADLFLGQTENNRFDLESRTAHLSKILDWYEGDFGDNQNEMLKYISRFLPDSVATSLASDAADWEVKYTTYDWSLNE